MSYLDRINIPRIHKGKQIPRHLQMWMKGTQPQKPWWRSGLSAFQWEHYVGLLAWISKLDVVLSWFFRTIYVIFRAKETLSSSFLEAVSKCRVIENCESYQWIYQPNGYVGYRWWSHCTSNFLLFTGICFARYLTVDLRELEGSCIFKNLAWFYD